MDVPKHENVLPNQTFSLFLINFQITNLGIFFENILQLGGQMKNRIPHSTNLLKNCGLDEPHKYPKSTCVRQTICIDLRHSTHTMKPNNVVYAHLVIEIE